MQQDTQDAPNQEKATQAPREPEGDAEVLETIAFVGTALAPFYLEDPLAEGGTASIGAMAALDPAQAADAWPLAESEEARAALELMCAGAREDAGALAQEYRRLFVGPTHKAAPPWGSVYTDRECVVFGASTLELREWMRARHLAAPNGTHTPEDHVGLMLALMAQLARQSRSAELDELLCRHLLTWVPHFCNVLERQAALPLYRGLARLTRASLAGIQRARGLSVVTPRFYR